MKQSAALSLLSLVFFALLACSQHAFAQAAGTKPELIMYRHNGGNGTAPKPALTGDLLGVLKWNAMTDINAIRTGASIQSTADLVAPGVLSADMLFRTSDNLGLKDRMVITSAGLVGIGIFTPQFHLDVLGNTHTSGRFYGRIHFDTGAATGLPGTYTDEAYFERKSRAALGLTPNAFADGGILSMAPGGNSLDRQLFVGGNDGIWTRSQHAGADSWDPWYRLLSSEDIEGHVGRIARFSGTNIGDLTSALHDSQLFDNGTGNVAVGENHPPTPPVFDTNYRLTVNGLATGAARINGKTYVNGQLGVGNSSPAEALDVTGNSTVSGNSYIGGNLGLNVAPTQRLDVNGNSRLNGNVGIGAAPTANRLEVAGASHLDGNVGIRKAPSGTFSLDVAGESNFDGRVKIGANLFPGSTAYKLAVGGGILAEEVRVLLQPWPDYVFEQNYPLTPLREVEKYIGENKHLPGVASAKEVADGGLNLGEMQKAQMEKIEEIYLHLIEMEKRVQALEAENTALKAQLSSRKH